MKTYILSLLFVASLLVTACGGTTATEETLPLPTQAATVELSEEEAEILDAAAEAPVEEAVPVTKENYEEALKQLEEEIEAEQ